MLDAWINNQGPPKEVLVKLTLNIERGRGGGEEVCQNMSWRASVPTHLKIIVGCYRKILIRVFLERVLHVHSYQAVFLSTKPSPRELERTVKFV
jgi:hypothetical protein